MEGLLAAELCAFTVLLKVTLDAPPAAPQGWLARLLRAPAATAPRAIPLEASAMTPDLAKGKPPRADRIDLDRKPR